GATTKPLAGHFQAAEVKPQRHLVELRTQGPSSLQLGQEVTVGIFSPGEHADVIGVSKGKGFSGTMKRHGFRGLSASHGTERKHRAPGGIRGWGPAAGGVRGTRMAGQTGNERVTVLNLEVIESDPERHLLLLRGAVPGPTGGLVMVRSSVKAGEAGRRNP